MSECLPAEPTRRALQVSSGARNQRRTSAKRGSDGIHRLRRLGSRFGEKHLNDSNGRYFFIYM
ncbi:hypothetical protein Taro_012123 [Colocasia esculenta]|uniref:Uncharacterized protein n=1 Tax=Colocasia esculenta TaxID=4460 RepID=A0A843UCS1_COLES|nr:hypothetical protein [Colocasia esculenta]